MNVSPESWMSPCSGKETQQTNKSNKTKDDFQPVRAEP
jgi:hypothetical protein